MYDHQLGRWHAIDPLAELYVGYSPYNYVLNNPINYLDPTGLGVEGWIKNPKEQMEYHANVHSQEDMANLGIEGTYMFEEGYWAGKDDFQSYYGADGGDPVPIVGGLETLTLMGEKPQEGNHVWFSWAATSQPSAQQQNMYMMSDALAEWSSNIILSAMGGYASSGLTPTITMVRSLPGVMGKQVAAKTGGTSLTRFLEKMGTNTKGASEFFGWGNKTTLTKSISDFTKEGLLKNGWTKDNLVKLARAYNDQIVKAQLAGAKNPAAVVRRDQAMELARTFFGN